MNEKNSYIRYNLYTGILYHTVYTIDVIHIRNKGKQLELTKKGKKTINEDIDNEKSANIDI